METKRFDIIKLFSKMFLNSSSFSHLIDVFVAFLTLLVVLQQNLSNASHFLFFYFLHKTISTLIQNTRTQMGTVGIFTN